MPWERIEGWIERYDERHPGTTWQVEPERLHAESPDGSLVDFAVPFPPLADPNLPGLVAHLARPWQLGVVLVRRGGFAVAWVVGPEITESKVGQRHVQGRTKAGGWSQQRFARRRDNQAKAAFDAAAGHVARILGPVAPSLNQIATGGDRQAVDTVLAASELETLADVPRQWIGSVADPRRGVLEAAVKKARSIDIMLTDPSR